MECDLIVELCVFTTSKLLRRCRDEIANAVVNVARLCADSALRQIIYCRIGEELDTLSFTDDVVTRIRDNSANLCITDLHARRAQIECVSHPRYSRELQQQSNLTLVRSLEDRGLRVEAEQSRGPPKVRLENLSNVHTARHAER